MGLRFKLTPKARQDLWRIIDYYRDQQPGLEARFFEELRSLVERICAHPEPFPIVRNNRRRANFPRKFPYIIFYYIEDQRVVIVAIMHKKRGPESIKKRI